jgi:hypothetical protein
MANNSQGNITIAPNNEIRIVLSVRVIASNGAAANNTPSERFETKLADHNLLNALPIVKPYLFLV